MILPTKGVHARRALLTVGGEILGELNEPKTVSRLWADIRTSHSEVEEADISFDWFVLALDLVFALGAVRIGEDSFVTRSQW